MKPVYISFLVLALAVSNSQCFDCYVCLDTDDGPCFAPEKNDVKHESCSTSSESTFKEILPGFALNKKTNVDPTNREDIEMVCFMHKTKADGKKIVQRGCGEKNAIESLCDQMESSDEIKVDYCKTCTTDLCNSAVNARMSQMALMATVIVSIVFAKLH